MIVGASAPLLTLYDFTSVPVLDEDVVKLLSCVAVV